MKIYDRKFTDIRKTYRLILWLYPTINKFPKSQRFVLGQQIENAALSILTGIIISNAERDKTPALKRVSASLDTLRILANVYLDALDRHAKRVLGIRRYIRYMDDFLILGGNAASLHEMKVRIIEFLESGLGFTLHPKKANVFPTAVGVPFLGYRVFRSHRLLRKSTVAWFARRVRWHTSLLAPGDTASVAFSAGLQSWSAYADDAASRGLKRSLARRLCISFAPIINSPASL